MTIVLWLALSGQLAAQARELVPINNTFREALTQTIPSTLTLVVGYQIGEADVSAPDLTLNIAMPAGLEGLKSDHPANAAQRICVKLRGVYDGLSYTASQEFSLPPDFGGEEKRVVLGPSQDLTAAAQLESVLAVALLGDCATSPRQTVFLPIRGQSGDLDLIFQNRNAEWVQAKLAEANVQDCISFETEVAAYWRCPVLDSGTIATRATSGIQRLTIAQEGLQGEAKLTRLHVSLN